MSSESSSSSPPTSFSSNLEWAQSISLPSPQQKSFEDEGFPSFPYILTPSSSSSYPPSNLSSFIELIESSRPQLLDRLLQHGAILFRDFPTPDAHAFDQTVTAFGFGNLPYVGGAAVRTNVIGNVYTANEAPADQLIPFHHEMAQVAIHPHHIFFYCSSEASSGGETPLLLSALLYNRLSRVNPAFIEKLERRKVRYIRYLPKEDDPTSAIGRGWKSTFHVTNKDDAAVKCKEGGNDFEWKENDVLKTISPALDAVRFDTRTGKKVFFNSLIAAYLGWQDSRNDRTQALRYADDLSVVDPQDIEQAAKIADEIKIAFRWKKGDFIVVDNIQCMHSRHAFTGPRQIFASLAKN